MLCNILSTMMQSSHIFLHLSEVGVRRNGTVEGQVKRSEVRSLLLGEEYTVTLTLHDEEEEQESFDFIACKLFFELYKMSKKFKKIQAFAPTNDYQTICTLYHVPGSF
jgi:hypothetical protein